MKRKIVTPAQAERKHARIAQQISEELFKTWCIPPDDPEEYKYFLLQHDFGPDTEAKLRTYFDDLVGEYGHPVDEDKFHLFVQTQHHPDIRAAEWKYMTEHRDALIEAYGELQKDTIEVAIETVADQRSAGLFENQYLNATIGKIGVLYTKMADFMPRPNETPAEWLTGFVGKEAFEAMSKDASESAETNTLVDGLAEAINDAIENFAEVKEHFLELVSHISGQDVQGSEKEDEEEDVEFVDDPEDDESSSECENGDGVTNENAENAETVEYGSTPDENAAEEEGENDVKE